MFKFPIKDKYFQIIVAVVLLASCAKNKAIIIKANKAKQPQGQVNPDNPMNQTSQNLNITAIMPFKGSSEGGTTMKIQGNGFDFGLTVLIGGSPCESITFSSPSEIHCVTPKHAAGVVNITLNSKLGETYTAHDIYTFENNPPPNVARGIASGGGISMGPGIQLNATIGLSSRGIATQTATGSSGSIGIQLRTGIQGTLKEIKR